MKKKQKVALTLSSGGARGMAHIGVIEELIKNGFEISSIGGTSIGAVVGAFYAAGKLEEYKEWMISLSKLDIFKLMDFTISTNGVVKGEKLFKELQKILGKIEIEELPIPFAAVATNLVQKQQVVFKKGNLLEALRATTAVPTLLKPVIYNNQELLDGAIINPLPIDQTERIKGDVLACVNLNAQIAYTPKIRSNQDLHKRDKFNNIFAPLKQKWQKLSLSADKNQEYKLGYFDLMNKSFDLTQDQLSAYIIRTYKPDISVEISRESCTTLEFDRAEELIEEGRKAFYKAISENKNVLKQLV